MPTPDEQPHCRPRRRRRFCVYPAVVLPYQNYDGAAPRSLRRLLAGAHGRHVTG